MTLVDADLYQALRAAHVTAETATKAAKALDEFAHDVRVLKWLMAASVLLIALVAGLYVVLFTIVERLA